jgi:aryl-alcohol dehydrogenase-like predicted oxidoreductase
LPEDTPARQSGGEFPRESAMDMRRIGHSPLKCAPILFGGNVLGWTVNETSAFKILDAFVGAGFNAIDTADTYSRWIPGNKGGESGNHHRQLVEARWRAARTRPDLYQGGPRDGAR